MKANGEEFTCEVRGPCERTTQVTRVGHGEAESERRCRHLPPGEHVGRHGTVGA